LVDIKRDTLKFLRILCTKYDYMQNLINQITSTYRCNSCDDAKITTENNVLLFQFLLII